MEWSREELYRRIQEAHPGELDALQKQVEGSPWRQAYHIQPSTGLLNDPNGFAYYQGKYHLFYQWFPFGPVHGMKHWYHTASTDLVRWHNVGVGIEPTEFFESHGAYSGSGIVHEGKLYLFYTGNTHDADWVRHPYQCMAVMHPDGRIEKWEKPVIAAPPEGYTSHFRDPKVWKEGEHFFAVIGAQRKKDETGCILLYRSPDLREWEWVGELETALPHFGYMWECPDYFEADRRGVLMFSPQGLTPQGDSYQNIYQSGYLLGEPLDFHRPRIHHGPFREWDNGFDFYAPQTTESPDGRRILVGWMGLPDLAYPTDAYGWAHCLTLPREVIRKGDQLLQQPVRELDSLRGESLTITDAISSETKAYEGFLGTTYELECRFTPEDASAFGVELRVGDEEKTVIRYDKEQKKVILDRSSSGAPVAVDYGTSRARFLDADEICLRIFMDVSSIELFVNDGEAVFTSRIFPSKTSGGIRFFSEQGKTEMEAVLWPYQLD
ncbi:glycoside hydrolase family 32 protein [Desmospora profundinema]|uniref:Sucrose-6-phosphate hydrolase n=1 Tax=Desmospora profundinema TaxID=1571184 RepID=A0ABU1IK82_9BACL|nr:sucrose-6-phosphate hydrolase [Desmospora profundinema]MDR6225181.1 beta-fructofuranosidase [Desmospora profundinema]